MQKGVVMLIWSLLVVAVACKKAAPSQTSGTACQSKPGLCAALRSGKPVACSETPLSACPAANKVGTCQLEPDAPDGPVLTYYKDFVGDPKLDCTDGHKLLKPSYTPISG